MGQHIGDFDANLGQPCLPSPRDNLNHHFQPCSLKINVGYDNVLEQQGSVFLAGLELQSWSSSKASFGHPCLPSSRENLEDNSQSCFAEFEVDFDDVLGQQKNLNIAGLEQPCLPSSRAHFSHMFLILLQVFLTVWDCYAMDFI